MTALPLTAPDGRELTVAEAAFVDIMNQYNDLETLIGQAAQLLPDLPTDPATGNATCCDQPRIKLICVSVQQWSSYEPTEHAAYGDGIADFGEPTDDSHLTCCHCWRVFRIPEELEWKP